MIKPPSKLGVYVRNGFVYAGVIALAAAALAPILWALWRVLQELLTDMGAEVAKGAPDRIYADSLRIGWTIVASGLVIACMVILLRLKYRQEDERGPPLAPALAIVGVGAILVAVVALAR
jgi:hypothetical protein